MTTLYNLKKNIKASALGGIATGIGDIYSAPKSILLYGIRFAKKGTAILIGTPTHHNIGDHLLAFNEKAFLTTQCKFNHIYEIPTRIYQHNRELLRKIIPADIPIFITGGGWMGDIWLEDQEVIENIVHDYSNNTLIILPQTIYYMDINSPRINRTKRIFSEARSLTLMCREKNSLYLAKKLFESNNTRVCMFPDMGLYRLYSGCKRRSGIGICLRDDREKSTESDVKNIIINYASSRNRRIDHLTTINDTPVPLWRRKRIINNLITEFGKVDIVITDRLHGMIFAIIAGVKCIALDNKTHKVKGVCEAWLSKYNVVDLMEDDEISMIDTLLDSAYERIDIRSSISNIKQDMSDNFTQMAEYIRSIAD